MPVLDWIGKQAVVKHHRDVPYRLLEPVPKLGCGDADGRCKFMMVRNRHWKQSKRCCDNYSRFRRCIELLLCEK